MTTPKCRSPSQSSVAAFPAAPISTVAGCCAGGKLNLEVSDEEIAARQAVRERGSAPGPKTGYQQLYIEHVLQADEGCDFDFLVGKRGSAVPRHSH